MKDLSFITNEYMKKVVRYSNRVQLSNTYILASDFNHQYNLKYLSTITKDFNIWYSKFEYTNNIHKLFNNDLNVLIEL